MPVIRIIAAVATIVATFSLTFPIASAAARPCGQGQAACAETKPGAPLRLNQFLKPKRAAKPAVTHEAQSSPAAAKADAESDPAPAQLESRADVAQAPALDTGPVRTIETDGVAVTSADELNEIDALAGTVQIVAANELNEIDLAAPKPTLNAYALPAMASAGEPAVDTAWIGQLLAAFAGTIAVAAAARLLIA